LSRIDSAGSSIGAQTVSLPVGGLAPDQTYLYRLVATNADGTTTGVVRSFTTGPAG
jgi:phosphodiesterase/alkaline phosphatase D-like protein